MGCVRTPKLCREAEQEAQGIYQDVWLRHPLRVHVEKGSKATVAGRSDGRTGVVGC